MNRFAVVKTVCGISALLLFAPVFADSDESDTFKQLDVNGDGYISQSEASGDSELLGQWSSADQNSDGVIEMSEFSAFEESNVSSFDEVISD